MAKPKRPDGTLQDNVLRLLRGEARPLSGTKLTELLRKEGYVVPSSLVFRAIRRLLDNKAIRKIQLAGGYVIRGPAPRISLCCSRCGAWEEIAHDLSFAGLDAAAEELGFTVFDHIVEAVGTCGRCGAFDETGRSQMGPPRVGTAAQKPLPAEAEIAGGQMVAGEEDLSAAHSEGRSPAQPTGA